MERAPALTPLRLEEVRDAARLEAIAPAWRGLVAAAAEANPLFEPEMALPALRHLAPPRGFLWLAVWRDEAAGAQLVGLFPLVPRRTFAGLPVPGLVMWHHVLGFMTTPPVKRDCLDEVCAAFAGWLASRRGTRIFAQPMAVTGGPVDQALRRALLRRGARLAPFEPRSRAALASPLPGDVYLQCDGRARLRTYRRLHRRLAERGDLVFSVTGTDGDLESAAADFLTLEQAGWKGRRGTAMVQSAGQRAFFREAVAAWARIGACRIPRLVLDGTTVASLVLITSGARAWTWKIAHDERFAHFSPGVLLMIEVTRHLCDGGEFAFVDSCAPAGYPMIDRIWRERTEITDLVFDLRPGALSTPALFAAERARRLARRLAKSAARALPGRPRRDQEKRQPVFG